MQESNCFIVIRELKTTTSATGNIVTEEFVLSEIINTLGDGVHLSEYKIHYCEGKVLLMLTCEKKALGKTRNQEILDKLHEQQSL